MCLTLLENIHCGTRERLGNDGITRFSLSCPGYVTPSDIPWGGLHCCMSQCLTSPILGSSLVSSVVLSSKPFPITHAESTPLATDSHHPNLMLRPRLKLTIHSAEMYSELQKHASEKSKDILAQCRGKHVLPFHGDSHENVAATQS